MHELRCAIISVEHIELQKVLLKTCCWLFRRPVITEKDWKWVFYDSTDFKRMAFCFQEAAPKRTSPARRLDVMVYRNWITLRLRWVEYYAAKDIKTRRTRPLRMIFTQLHHRLMSRSRSQATTKIKGDFLSKRFIAKSKLPITALVSIIFNTVQTGVG